jgi:hypothetical protein
MRIVVSGSHGTGKTTLVADLAARLKGYVAIEEPYYALEAEGHAFGSPPGIDDFEMLIERATTSIADHTDPNAIFDRGPIDYLAYLAVVSHDVTNVMHVGLPAVLDALASIDLFLFVPIEEPDRMADVDIEARGLRRRVDALLRSVFLEDAWGLNLPVLRVAGAPAERTIQVAAWLDSAQVGRDATHAPIRAV